MKNVSIILIIKSALIYSNLILMVVHSPVINWSIQASSLRGETAVLHEFLFMHRATIWVTIPHPLRDC